MITVAVNEMIYITNVYKIDIQHGPSRTNQLRYTNGLNANTDLYTNTNHSYIIQLFDI